MGDKNYINKDYWNNTYLNKKITNESLFEQYIYQNISKNSSKNKRLIDIVCGLGRDSLYFLNNGFEVIGIDGSEVVIERLKDKES